MRSPHEAEDRPPEDLTARARIRDAALALFAEHGVAGTSIRAVASAAGVSPGLVQHHFGSKRELRAACDTHVTATLMAQAQRGVGGEVTSPDMLAGMYAASSSSVRYLARALVDGSPGATDLFDHMAAAAEDFLSGQWPDRFPPGARTTRERGASMAAMHLGAIVLHGHLSRRMGVEILDTAHVHRIGASMLDVYARMGEYLASDTGAAMAAAVTEYEREHSDDDGRGSEQ